MHEAKNINLSLHFLQRVIVSLNEKQGHIPYRDSMMTMCLRDSLGGNCKTRMIANISGEFIDVSESISTCRFAERVSKVSNNAIKNEIEDPSLIIQKQKSEINELRSELAMLKGKDQKEYLDKEDIINCKQLVEAFLRDDTGQTKINLKDMLMISECFEIIKTFYKDLEKKLMNYNNSEHKEIVISDNNVNLDKMNELELTNKRLSAEVDRLKELLKRRDEEMKVLLSALERKNQRSDMGSVFDPNKSLLSRINEEEAVKLMGIKNDVLGKVVNFDSVSQSGTGSVIGSSTHSGTDFLKNTNISTTSINKPQQTVPTDLLRDINIANSYLISPVSPQRDEKETYNLFKANYLKSKIIEQNKVNGKALYKKGQELGEEYKKFMVIRDAIKSEVDFIIIIINIDRDH
jgi:kinesin family protein 6/9